MIENKKVVKNASWIIICKIVQSVLGLIITMLTVRYLGPSNYGLVSYAASVVAFFVPIMQLGLPGILVHEFINHPQKDGEILGTSLVLSFISSIACIIGVISFVFIANADDPTTILVSALYSIMLIPQALELVQYWFQAQLASKYVSIAGIFAYIVVSVYKIYLLTSGKSVYWFAISSALDCVIISIVLLIIYKKLSKSGLKFSASTAKKLLSRGSYYIVSNIMITIFAQTDRIMLKLMIDDAAVGYYSAAVSCASMTSFVFCAVIDSMRPMIFESKKNSELQFELNITRLYSIIIYLSFAQSVVMTLFADFIVNVLYGIEYKNTVAILQVLVWYTAFSYFGGAKDVWLLAENKQKYLMLMYMTGAFANIGLNMMLIPIWGGIGAAIASLITQIISNVVICQVIKPLRYNNLLLISSLNPKYLIGTIRELRKSVTNKLK